MSQKIGKNNNMVYRLVLTGGPCGGKTTGQARLCTFFENLGWKVFRVPETATVLMGGGVKFSDMGEEEVFRFQENLVKTMMQIEQTFFDLAASSNQNCLVICDRGAMDASAYCKPEQWDRMKQVNRWNNVELRDNRYNQVIHMVSAAKGAEIFYQTDNNIVRSEDVDFARKLDDMTAQAWVGHPYYDVIDNSTDFERKMVRMMAAVCNRLGLDHGDRLRMDSRKRKFLVKALPDEKTFKEMIAAQSDGSRSNSAYPQFQDFIVMHDYLVTPSSKMQARIRRRGQNVKWDEEIERWNYDSGFVDNRTVVPYLSTCIKLEHRERALAKSHQKVTSKVAIKPKCFMFGRDKDLSNWTYTHTIRRPKINEEAPEMKMQITVREYELLLAQKDMTHYTIYKKRRCFLWNNQYFQMDIYQEPCPPRCKGLIILETYTSQIDDVLQVPDFLEIERQITEDSDYSMYNLSVKPASAIQNRVRSVSEGEDQIKINGRSKGGKSGGSKLEPPQENGHYKVKKHSIALDGRNDILEVVMTNSSNLTNGTSGSINDVWMSCDSSGDSS